MKRQPVLEILFTAITVWALSASTMASVAHGAVRSDIRTTATAVSLK